MATILEKTAGLLAFVRTVDAGSFAPALGASPFGARTSSRAPSATLFQPLPRTPLICARRGRRRYRAGEGNVHGVRWSPPLPTTLTPHGPAFLLSGIIDLAYRVDLIHGFRLRGRLGELPPIGRVGRAAPVGDRRTPGAEGSRARGASRRHSLCYLVPAGAAVHFADGTRIGRWSSIRTTSRRSARRRGSASARTNACRGRSCRRPAGDHAGRTFATPMSPPFGRQLPREHAFIIFGSVGVDRRPSV